MPVSRDPEHSRTRRASPEGGRCRARRTGADSHSAGTPAAGTPASEAPATEAEILLGVTTWLAAARDWFDEEVTLARGRLGLDAGDAAGEGASVTMKLVDVERLIGGLSGVVGCLDRLTVDPSRIRALAGDAAGRDAERGTLQ